MIAIINYGLGNVGSIHNMLNFLGVESKIIDSPSQLKDADKIILPGVGSFDTGMNLLNEGGWLDPLNEKVLVKKTPVLGICLGMQLMTMKSEEGKKKGLGWVDGVTERFNFDLKSDIKTPHMGWNQVALVNESNLHYDLNQLEVVKYYHVHSYYVKIKNPKNTIFNTNYGFEFCSGFQHENIYGVQFHPEKSHKYGMILMINFSKI